MGDPDRPLIPKTPSDPPSAAASERAASVPAQGIERTLLWMRAHHLFGSLENTREYQKQAVVAATFGYLCAPRRAEDGARQRAARFTAIFLYLDDTTSKSVMSDSQWHTFHASLIDLLRDRRAADGAEHAAVAEWLAELRAIGQGAPSALCDFERSFLDYCLSLDEERRADPAAMSEQEFLALRRRTIFVEPVLDHWRVVMGLEVPVAAPFRAELLAAQGMARDLVILANDLGSLVRDAGSETTEKNVILHRAQHRGERLEAAAERAVTEYNTRVAELQRALADIADSERSGAAWSAPLADLLAGLVDGDLDSMELLVQRYDRSESWLRGLHRVRPAPA